MAGISPQGSEKFWQNGLPAEHLAKTTPINEGTEKFWINGLPGESLFPAVAIVANTGNFFMFLN